jgi:hypothetical protein
MGLRAPVTEDDAVVAVMRVKVCAGAGGHAAASGMRGVRVSGRG